MVRAPQLKDEDESDESIDDFEQYVKHKEKIQSPYLKKSTPLMASPLRLPSRYKIRAEPSSTAKEYQNPSQEIIYSQQPEARRKSQSRINKDFSMYSPTKLPIFDMTNSRLQHLPVSGSPPITPSSPGKKWWDYKSQKPIPV
jgi:hypothetical protein